MAVNYVEMRAAERWLTVNEIAERLQVNEQTVRRWLREGRLDGTNMGGKIGYRVREKDLGGFLGETPGEPDPKPPFMLWSRWENRTGNPLEKVVEHVRFTYGARAAQPPGNVDWYLYVGPDQTINSVETYKDRESAEMAQRSSLPMMANTVHGQLKLIDSEIHEVGYPHLHPSPYRQDLHG